MSNRKNACDGYDALGELSNAGVAVYLDHLGRSMIADGTLASLVDDRHVVGVTTDPTVFARAAAADAAYLPGLEGLAAGGVTGEEAAGALMARDIADACDLLLDVHRRTRGVDGWVAAAVDPRLAHDPQATLAAARELCYTVDRPNLHVKIPATEAGLPAIADALAEGISVNASLIFSMRRYDQVIEAFFSGLERAKAAGRELKTISSAASFPISPIDAEVDVRLVGRPHRRGAAGLANASLAFHRHEQWFRSARWLQLRAAGARPQRPLWESTATDTRYVTELVAGGCIAAMSPAAMRAMIDHGLVHGDTLHGTLMEARRVWAELEAVGIDYEQVMAMLEERAIAGLLVSREQLLDTIGSAVDLAG